MNPLEDVSATQLDYDAFSQELLWADTNKGVISVDMIQGGHRRNIAEGFAELSAIAVDWVSRLIYFSDHLEEILGVARLDGRYIKTLQESVAVSSIALDPENGYGNDSASARVCVFDLCLRVFTSINTIYV